MSSGKWGPAGSQLPSQPGCPGVRAEKRPRLRGGACLGLLWGFGRAHASAPRVLREGCDSWGGFSAWPADLRQVTISHWASISLCVKWDKSSTHRGETPRETMHLKRLAEFMPSRAVHPGVPTPGSCWAEGFQLLQALEEQEELPRVLPPQPAKSILGGISSQWAGGWQRQCRGSTQELRGEAEGFSSPSPHGMGRMGCEGSDQEGCGGVWAWLRSQMPAVKGCPRVLTTQRGLKGSGRVGLAWASGLLAAWVWGSPPQQLGCSSRDKVQACSSLYQARGSCILSSAPRQSPQEGQERWGQMARGKDR